MTIEKMREAIKNWNVNNSTSENDLLSMIYKSTKSEQSHIINMLISKKAEEDYKKINEALQLIQEYEKKGVQFEFINYKTKTGEKSE